MNIPTQQFSHEMIQIISYTSESFFFYQDKIQKRPIAISCSKIENSKI